MAKPRLIVFDLDFTLWPLWIDRHLTPPFRKNRRGAVYDTNNTRVLPYKDVAVILEELYKAGDQMAVASRTSEQKGALSLLSVLTWDKYFPHKEIYPASKRIHFENLSKKTGIQYCDMLFFDDESRNIEDVSALGVTCVLVDHGMSRQHLKKGLELFAKKQASN